MGVLAPQGLLPAPDTSLTFLFPSQDPETGELQSLCRVMSGFTDVFYREATERFKVAALLTAAPQACVVHGGK
jgi:ATP-dependent DNA ligase